MVMPGDALYSDILHWKLLVSCAIQLPGESPSFSSDGRQSLIRSDLTCQTSWLLGSELIAHL